MKCNIDKTGRLLRLATGLLLAANSVIMYIYALPGDGFGWRFLQIAMGAAGLFTIFEAIAGWCALRALGIRTRW